MLQNVHYKIKIDGDLVKEWSGTEPRSVNYTTPVNVYLGSPWRNPIKGKIRNLVIVSKVTPPPSEPKTIRPLKDTDFVETLPTKGNLVMTLKNYGYQYTIKFEMKIKAFSEHSSVIHFGNSDRSRMPAVFLHPTRHLQVSIDSNSGNNYYHEVKARTWYTIEISKSPTTDANGKDVEGSGSNSPNIMVTRVISTCRPPHKDLFFSVSTGYSRSTASL